MNNNTIFCRILWQTVKADFKIFCKNNNYDYKDILKNSWAYLYKSNQYSKSAEFQINKCKDIPEGFYWHGSADNKSHAKAEGLRAFIDLIEEKKEK
jgi:hypothetical protein